jgi:2-polyprenyl-3-methyl-5-hydroxy-6-metoxy-1,4-benzoquinol methylase
MTNRISFTPDYFERLYSKEVDPWRFATSNYERLKYAATLSALEGRQIDGAFEVGCSIGIFTKALARRCGSLVSVDVSETALTAARRNCANLDNVTIQPMQIPHEWPVQSFDLILLSEVLYFLGPDDIRLTARKSINSLTQNGLVMLVNWIGETDYPCGGDEAAGIFLAESAETLRLLLQRREENYRLDLVGLV